jgi:deoxyribose-phosphate aldolase
VNIATVIGFPLGHMTTAAKVFEAEQAIKDGADEVDMVINIGWLLSGLNKEVQSEIKQIKKACNKHPLKVIVETCYLNED